MARSYVDILNKHLNILNAILSKHNIISAKDYIEKYKQDDEEFNAATIFHLGHIGENTRMLEQEIKDKDTSIRWLQIERLRNIAFHDYDGVNFDFVAALLFNDIPKLKALIRKVN